MLYVKCKCGSGVAVPEDFLATLGECPDCRRTFRVVAGPGTSAITEEESDARLVIKSGPQRVGEQLVLRGQTDIEIGKLQGKPIELVGNMVSRNHCKLVRTPTGWSVEDLKSTNGLFVNGKRVAAADLKSGDSVRVGDFELEYAVANVGEEDGASSLDDVEDVYEMAEEPTVTRLPPPIATPAAAELQPGPGTISCPACGKLWPVKAKICIDCGIDVKTGRAVLVSSDVDENAVHVNTETAVRAISWIIPLGLYPVASEGYGKFKPYTVWAITAATTLVTILVWIASAAADGPGIDKSLMMWGGRQPTAVDIERGQLINDETRWGDTAAFEKNLESYRAKNVPDEEATVKAYEDLSPDQKFYGEFHWYQLITNGFLHGGILHLAGNLLFLLVFGSRVNALIGQWRTAVLYPILLIIASGAELISLSGGPPMPALGASGAIMGLAGMYFVLFPVHRVYMVIWLRLGLLTGFRLAFKIWALRGFWVVLFYIFFDVLATVLGSKDDVAHWAHLGGFIAGMVLAITLLLTRQVDAKGGDIVSAMLGRRAWALLGKPGARQHREEAAQVA